MFSINLDLSLQVRIRPGIFYISGKLHNSTINRKLLVTFFFFSYMTYQINKHNDPVNEAVIMLLLLLYNNV